MNQNHQKTQEESSPWTPEQLSVGSLRGSRGPAGWPGFLSPQTAGEGCHLSMMIQTPHQENQA